MVEQVRPKITAGEFNQVQIQLGTLLFEADEMRETVRKVQSGELQKRLEGIDQEYNQIEARLEQAVESL